MTEKSNNTTSQPIELTRENNKPMATSIQVARHFGKRHADVLKAIERAMDYIKEFNEQFNQRNFTLIEYVDAKGEKRPTYLLSRDGFSLLAMGFTGKKALAWKIKYIDAFNEMEALLRKESIQKLLRLKIVPKSETEIIAYGRAIIEGLLGFWANEDNLPYKTALKILCSHLNLSSLDDFTADHFPEACSYLIHASCFLNNEYKPISPEKLENIERLLTACSSFRYSANIDFQDMLLHICGASLDNYPKSDPDKLTKIAWGLFHHSRGYTLGYLDGQETLIQKMVN